MRMVEFYGGPWDGHDKIMKEPMDCYYRLSLSPPKKSITEEPIADQMQRPVAHVYKLDDRGYVYKGVE